MATADGDDYTATSLPESEDLGTDFDKDLLTCCVCLEYYNQPKVLSCHHTFCLTCLQSLHGNQQNLNGAQNVVPANILCPICREPSAVPEAGIEAFPNDFKAETVKKALQYAKNLYKSRSHLCDICEQVKSFPLATEFCCDCRKHFCPNCFNRHQSTLLFRSHSTCNLEAEPAQKLCDNHQTPREQVEYWCQDCSDLLCIFCVIQEHTGHELMDLEMASTNKKNYIQDCLSEIDHCLPKFDTTVQKLEKYSQLLRTKYEKLCDTIKTEADRVVKQVAEREEELLTEVETAYQTECALLDSKIEDLNYERDCFTSLKNGLVSIDTSDICNFMATGINAPMGRIKKAERDLSVDPTARFLHSTKLLRLEYHASELTENCLGTVIVATSDLQLKSDTSTREPNTSHSCVPFSLDGLDAKIESTHSLSNSQNLTQTEACPGLVCDGSTLLTNQRCSLTVTDNARGGTANDVPTSENDMTWMKLLRLQLNTQEYSGQNSINPTQ